MANAMMMAGTRPEWDHMDGWGSSWMWVWGPLMMALFVVFAIWLARTGVGSGGPSDAHRPDPLDRARALLAERYARGEMTTEEYRERVSELH